MMWLEKGTVIHACEFVGDLMDGEADSQQVMSPTLSYLPVGLYSSFAITMMQSLNKTETIMIEELSFVMMPAPVLSHNNRKQLH